MTDDMTDEIIRVKAELKEAQVVVESKDGSERKLILRELLGKERNKYLDKMAKRVDVNTKSGKPTVRSFQGMHAELLTKSLFDEVAGEYLSAEEIEEMPSTAQEKLFENAQKLSGLDINVEDVEKNA